MIERILRLLPIIALITFMAGCNGVSRSKGNSSKVELPRGSAAYGVEDVKERAKLGQAVYQHHLAVLYRAGKGVPRDLGKAYEWELKAANQKFMPSYYWIGVHKLYGDGTYVNEEEALEWFQKAADAGFTPAIRQIGLMHIKGQGVRKDLDDGIKLLRKAASQGDKLSARILLESYGIRVPQ